MSEKYVEPKYKLDGFDCPHCGAFANQKWYRLYQDQEKCLDLPNYTPIKNVGTSSGYVGAASGVCKVSDREKPLNRTININTLSLNRCDRCNNFCIWLKDIMAYPASLSAPLPNPDIPEEVKEDFLEARKVVELSPRASSALLRLALQKLMKHLGCEGKNLDYDIGQLVEKGLPTEIQMSLDSVRVIGNEAVHPGTLDLKDDKETAIILFELLNMIVQDRISHKKVIKAIYSKLPKEKLKGIEDRDKKSN